MAVASHLQELRRKHEHLSEMVEQAQRQPRDGRVEDCRVEKAETPVEGRNQPSDAALIVLPALARAASAAPRQSSRPPPRS